MQVKKLLIHISIFHSQTEQLTTICIEVIESDNLLSDKQINVSFYKCKLDNSTKKDTE